MATSSRLSGQRDKSLTAVRAKSAARTVRRFKLADHGVDEDGEEQHQRLG